MTSPARSWPSIFRRGSEPPIPKLVPLRQKLPLQWGRACATLFLEAFQYPTRLSRPCPKAPAALFCPAAPCAGVAPSKTRPGGPAPASFPRRIRGCCGFQTQSFPLRSRRLRAPAACGVPAATFKGRTRFALFRGQALARFCPGLRITVPGETTYCYAIVKSATKLLLFFRRYNTIFPRKRGKPTPPDAGLPSAKRKERYL